MTGMSQSHVINEEGAMRVFVPSCALLLVLVPSIALAGPPAFPVEVVNGADQPIPVQGAVAVSALPTEKLSEAFDLSVNCSGTGPTYQCDATWEAPVAIEYVSAHCTGTGGSVAVLKVVSSIGPNAPSTPADKVTVAAGTGATNVTAFEGARRFLPLTFIPSLNAAAQVTTLVPVSVRILVPPERFVRLIFEGNMTSASCFVAFAGHWLRP